MKAMTRHRSDSIEFKRQVAHEYVAGETLRALPKRHDVSRYLIRIWVAKFEAGAFDDDAQAADLIQEYEAKIAALERMVGAPGARDRVSKGGPEKRTAAEKRDYIRHCRPRGLCVAEACRLMSLPHSTFYDVPATTADDTEIAARITAIGDEFEAHGYRRVGAELRHQGLVVNSKKIRRLTRACTCFRLDFSGQQSGTVLRVEG
jgi:hypothetical protein